MVVSTCWKIKNACFFFSFVELSSKGKQICLEIYSTNQVALIYNKSAINHGEDNSISVLLTKKKKKEQEISWIDIVKKDYI